MNELTIVEDGLIKVYLTDKDEYVVNGRELWQGLGSKRQFANWIKERLSDCDATENEDYFSFNKNVKRENGATVLKEYIIKLDTAKEMAMLERNEIGKQYRRYLISIEEKYRHQIMTIPADADNTKQMLAEAKLRNAKVREANVLLKAAGQLPKMQRFALAIRAAELITGERIGDRKMVAWQVEDNSMEPRFSAGDVVELDTQAQVCKGNIAVVKLYDQRIMVRQVFFHSGGQVILRPFNAQYDAEVLDAADVAMVGRVVRVTYASGDEPC